MQDALEQRQSHTYVTENKSHSRLANFAMEFIAVTLAMLWMPVRHVPLSPALLVHVPCLRLMNRSFNDLWRHLK